ncbi:metal ABC transporter substrate-binding protein [Nocardioides bizhenqiangii]|uniref:Metal ABC transporter substrate-binding protein n=1 Tax=Nocardioides bizhenqiangii TaxID=3095076 RepID=A0ABZ0ZV94_9ACTN|nr:MULTISPECIES: metal ABC transporter substrate-binding protein [unclassified Nocardioides]MDZ5623270.1 metal ABC transporter substrate-binding protein [Nocardioides sp. HM23]WQQ28241.1 metal ABC transporter substrate-binding protein [Nocardioides sp. HM61]
MRSRVLLPALTVLALTGAGCSAFDEGGASAEDGVTVAAAFYPLAYVAERVAGDNADVELLTQPGTEPHDLELNVNETAEIAGADLVVFEHGFQPAVDDAVEQNAEGVALDAADVVDLVAAEESHEEHAEHEGEEEHDHGDTDPHFWQDPLRVADLADAVADELAEIDPDHADDYRANATDLRSELEGLDSQFTSGLAACERDTIVVSHDAFGYLEKYGVHIAPLVGLSPDAEPSPAVIGELQELIRKEGITTVFSEPLEPDLVEGLASDLDLTTATLDPIEGLADASSDEDYLSLMQNNLEAIRKANECT